MRNADLEREILAAPDDPSGYLVYADWLQTHGDPRGELIVGWLQTDGDRHGEHIVRNRDDSGAEPFLAAHRELLLGRFANHPPYRFELAWRWGFIRKANIGWQQNGGGHGEDRANPSPGQLEAFLELDAACFLEELAIGPSPDEEVMSLDIYADVIEKVKPRALRTLYLGNTGDWDISGTSTRLPSCAAIAGLRSLTLRGGSVTIPSIDLPELVTFRVESGSLTQPELHAIATARWSNLEELEIWFGDPSYGATGSVTDILPILAGEGLGKLRRLGLRNCPFADDLAHQLAGAAVLAQLEELDLSMGNLSDRGVAAMLAATDRFAHLAKLTLDDNALTNASWPAARALAKTVVFGTDHDPDRAGDPEDPDAPRYVSVGE